MGTSEKLSKICETRMEDIAAHLNVRARVFVCVCVWGVGGWVGARAVPLCACACVPLRVCLSE